MIDLSSQTMDAFFFVFFLLISRECKGKNISSSEGSYNFHAVRLKTVRISMSDNESEMERFVKAGCVTVFLMLLCVRIGCVCCQCVRYRCYYTNNPLFMNELHL